jgi:exonuclease SbcC
VTQLNEELKLKRESANESALHESELASLNTEISSLSSAANRLESQAYTLLSEAGIEPDDEEAISGRYDKANERKGELASEKQSRIGEEQEAEQALSDNKPLYDEYPSVKEKHDGEEVEIAALDRAVKLVDATRDGIIGGVKQSIEVHMSNFLPALTDNRYSMAQIDENEYKIKVWDREAKGWREKLVFSGGTQDQFSLALRLSFALSTIPSTRGARPGFIFLDEPLSSFDAERRDGFMKLLVEELCKSFPQIIVVSHIEQLQEEFPNLIHLDSGRVIQ